MFLIFMLFLFGLVLRSPPRVCIFIILLVGIFIVLFIRVILAIDHTLCIKSRAILPLLKVGTFRARCYMSLLMTRVALEFRGVQSSSPLLRRLAVGLTSRTVKCTWVCSGLILGWCLCIERLTSVRTIHIRTASFKLAIRMRVRLTVIRTLSSHRDF